MVIEPGRDIRVSGPVIVVVIRAIFVISWIQRLQTQLCGEEQTINSRPIEMAQNFDRIRPVFSLQVIHELLHCAGSFRLKQVG